MTTRKTPWKRCLPIKMQDKQRYGIVSEMERATRWPFHGIPTQVEVRVDLGGSIYSEPINDFIERLKGAAEGLEDAEINIESHDEYGSTTTESYVSGWRDMTDAEIELWQQQRAEADKVSRALAEQRDERMIADLRQRRPELFQ